MFYENIFGPMKTDEIWKKLTRLGIKNDQISSNELSLRRKNIEYEENVTAYSIFAE
jgi:hypothetical protein